MHKSCESNWTDVVFGVLSQPMNSPIKPVSLSVLRSSLIDLFTQHSNLTLTKTIFGMPSSFEILKCPGGITIIPKLSPPVLALPKVLFNFTLQNSLQDIEEKFLELKVQLKSGLQLMPYEVFCRLIILLIILWISFMYRKTMSLTLDCINSYMGLFQEANNKPVISLLDKYK